MDTREAVAEGAEIFVDVEDAAGRAQRRLRQLRRVLEAVRDDGHIGSLECQALASRADALATQFEADVWQMHADLTRRAGELGIDLPQPRSGGGGR